MPHEKGKYYPQNDYIDETGRLVIEYTNDEGVTTRKYEGLMFKEEVNENEGYVIKFFVDKNGVVAKKYIYTKETNGFTFNLIISTGEKLIDQIVTELFVEFVNKEKGYSAISVKDGAYKKWHEELIKKKVEYVKLYNELLDKYNKIYLPNVINKENKR